MATHYLKARCDMLLSDSSDYALPRTPLREILDETEPTAVLFEYEIDAQTGGSLIDLALFTAVHNLVIHNRDATNYITVGYTDSNNSAAQTPTVSAGSWLRINNLTASADITLTADTADCDCTVYITGTVAT